MCYFVTGATGFIGRFLVGALLEREGAIFVLVRESSLAKFAELRRRWWNADENRVIPIVGDLNLPNLGVSETDLARLRGRVRHMFHLAALYELNADPDSLTQTNVEGARHAAAFAETIAAGCLHHVSSIAAAGLYEGVFREDMFEEAENLEHPYYWSKHESEGVIRRECRRPWRIYRPGIVVGHSETGEISKIDGPYYFFKLIQKLRNAVPVWLPIMGIEGGRFNIVPVDFVVKAIDHLAHAQGLDGKCFHLTDPNPQRVGDIFNIFAQAAHAPQASIRLNARLFEFIPEALRHGMVLIGPFGRWIDQLLQNLGIPKAALRFINYPTRFDSRETQAALKDSGIEPPPLENYAWRLWDYWERRLDPALFADRSLRGQVEGKVVIVTGASSGIGQATAFKLGRAGAKLILVARNKERLLETQQNIEREGGSACVYTCDITDYAACDALIKQVLADHATVDILINNAGRSIRRSLALSFDRFHDFERTMRLNYFGCVRLVLNVLPAMMARGSGQIINISSIGVLTNAPRFSAYVASKAALDAFSRCAAAEFYDCGISFTAINMPLVRTPMIAPTRVYRQLHALEPAQAADLVAKAIIEKPTRIATRLGIFGQIVHAVTPKLGEAVMNTWFRLFPDSAAARGLENAGEEQASSEQVALASLLRGIHW